MLFGKKFALNAGEKERWEKEYFHMLPSGFIDSGNGSEGDNTRPFIQKMQYSAEHCRESEPCKLPEKKRMFVHKNLYREKSMITP